jgi:hypothetical protein
MNKDANKMTNKPSLVRDESRQLLRGINEMDALSSRYQISKEDIMLVALNASALRMDEDSGFRRVRFKIALDERPDDIFYLGIPVLSKGTPFLLSNASKRLYFGDKSVGKVFEVENDTCDTSYFRREDTAMTININSRSNCFGCAICATLKQVATDKTPINTREALAEYIEGVFTDRDKLNMIRPHFHGMAKVPEIANRYDLHQLAVVTGCFKSEKEAVEKLEMTYDYFYANGFRGEFLYIGSEIQSMEALHELSRRINNMALFLSLECFTRRKQLLKKTKSDLTLDKAVEVLTHAKEVNIRGSFTYILGLDPLKNMSDTLREFVPIIGAFPIFQIFQPHWEEQKEVRIPEADSLEYYLLARKEIEDTFSGTDFKPKPWSNYRSPWYYTFRGEALNDIRV